MKLSRRAFLATGGAAAVSALAPGRLVAALEKTAPAAPALERWSDVRAQFALAPGVRHFSSFFLASHPKVVRDAIDHWRRTLDANPYETVEHALFVPGSDNPQARVLEEVARYLGGTPDEVALVGNTTSGLALVYHGLPLGPGDEVLATTHDHYVHHEVIRFATERAGATTRRIALHDAPASVSVDEVVGRVRGAIRPETRVLAVTWVHSSTGVRLPIAAIAAALREANAGRDEAHRVRLVVDGVHGIGALDESVAALGCDFFCAGTHKWMFAPRGTGIVWAKAENWARMRPVVPSFSEFEPFEAWMRGEPPKGPTTAARMTPGGFAAYEHQWGMRAAFQMHARMGRPRVAGRIRELNDQLKTGLASIRGVTLHTPRDPALSAGLAAFEVAGVSPDDVVKRLLERKIIASTSPYKVSYARLAPSLVNDPAEVDEALRAVRAIAGA